MSLRLRVVIAVLLVLASGSGFGLALAGMHARQWLRDEMTGAQASGRRTVERAFADLPHVDNRDRELTTLVYAFNGDRHQRVMLLAADGRVLAASTPARAESPPDWFGDILRQKVAPLRLPVPGPEGDLVDLVPVYTDNLAALWDEFKDLALVLAIASVSGVLVVFAVVGRALRPLRTVGEALPRIGGGDYAARALETGPPELVALSRGVNEMAASLAAMRDRTRALSEQILTLQDEERADIARDLHDEMGPQLFAANVDAAMAASLISGGEPEAALTQVQAIAGAITNMQRLVRDILGRLRPTRLAELGLSNAILELVEFWQARRPEIAFETELPEIEPPVAAQDILYRVAQESLANAIRHGTPKRVRIVIERREADACIQVLNDGAGATDEAQPPGYGLTGMGERVAAAGGKLSAGQTPDGGWRVAASLPLSRKLPAEVA